MLESRSPASSTRTRLAPSSVSLLAKTQPAVPAPTTTKSQVRMFLPPNRLGFAAPAGAEHSGRADPPGHSLLRFPRKGGPENPFGILCEYAGDRHRPPESALARRRKSIRTPPSPAATSCRSHGGSRRTRPRRPAPGRRARRRETIRGNGSARIARTPGHSSGKPTLRPASRTDLGFATANQRRLVRQETCPAGKRTPGAENRHPGPRLPGLFGRECWRARKDSNPRPAD